MPMRLALMYFCKVFVYEHCHAAGRQQEVMHDEVTVVSNTKKINCSMTKINHYCCFLLCASMTAMVTMFTMSRTLLPSCRMCTGFFIPRSTGPIASAASIDCSSLYAMFPASRFGKMSVLTPPLMSSQKG